MQSNQNLEAVAGVRGWGSAGDRVGADIAALPDLDADGDHEYAISAPGANDGDGVAYIVPGVYEPSGVYDIDEEVPGVATLNARQPIQILGSNGEGLSSLATGGDANGDGHEDLLIGAPTGNRSAANGGSVYVMYLGATGWTDFWDVDGYRGPST